MLRLDLDALNAAQRAAVVHRGAPLLVVAGAGSGKTRVITTRVAYLLEQGVAAEKILGVTFTNKAALEMRERVVALAGPAARRVELSTFHRLGLRVLREDHESVGLRGGFTIYDTSDQVSLLRDLMRRIQVADRRLDAAKVLNRVLQAKRQRLDEVPIDWGDDYEFAARELYPRYCEQMRAFNAVDFDDLILRAVDVVQTPALAPKWGARFSHIVVDEYQDTSPDQLQLLAAFAGHGENLCVVGDGDQSIYAWRGARAGIMLEFGALFPGAQEIVLEQNYRSTDAILQAANAVIANNRNRRPKRLWSARGDGEPVELVACSGADDEADFVAGTIQRLTHEGQRYHDFAVLFRSNNQSRLLEETFALERIHYRVVGGQSLFDRKDVRDALAFLAVALNPRDEVALRRIINVPPRGIGPRTLSRLADYAEANGMTLFSALEHADRIPELEARARVAIDRMVENLREHGRALALASPGQLAEPACRYLESFGLRDAIVQSNDPPRLRERRLDNFDQVLHALHRFDASMPNDGLSGFLRSTTLARDQDESNDDPRDCVTLITIHSAKGLEFPNVFMVGMEEDLLPHRRTMDEGEDLSEERRLCYVGITRAQRRLWLSYARSRVRHGKAEPRTPSRFLSELPEGVVRSESQADEGAEAEAAAAAFFDRMRSQLG